jgi:hypothetical protein
VDFSADDTQRPDSDAYDSDSSAESPDLQQQGLVNHVNQPAPQMVLQQQPARFD